jgi:hypothetical protein
MLGMNQLLKFLSKLSFTPVLYDNVVLAMEVTGIAFDHISPFLMAESLSLLGSHSVKVLPASV